jgi:hypothetical protein
MSAISNRGYPTMESMTGPTRIRLMSEYSAESPLWGHGGVQFPEDLGLSADLGSRLLAWEDHFERHFDHELGWDSLESRKWYGDHVDELVRDLQQELGPDVELVVDLWPLDA